MQTVMRGLAAAVSILAALPSFGMANPTNPPAPAPRSATVVATREAVRIDGRLSEETWASAPIVTGLLQRDPEEGKPATERTEIRVAYDDKALYIGARLFDSEPKRLVRQRSRRDVTSASDHLRVYLDPHHDHKTGVMLTVSAAGSLADAWLSNDFERDTSWDGVWDAAVTVDDLGWTVEMRVPFSQLRFPPGAIQTWGLNVSRFVQRKNEEDWWVLVPKTDSRLVSGFGHLEGLENIRPRQRLELLPYATVGVERAGTTVAGDPFAQTNKPAGGLGLDLKWGMSSSFTMDGTVNPDFGQVELDPAVVNLTAFETFYQEKRPFFIEGSQQFNTFGRNGLPLYGRFGSTYPNLWYSRRVGRSPRLNASGEFVDQPTATTILGAAKVTGRTAGGWNMSVVDAVTAREMAQVAVGDTRSTMEVEPLSNYAALRASRDVAGRGAFGVIATGVNRSLQTEALQRTTPGGAYTGGVDGNWFLDSQKSWVVSGSFAASHVWGDEAVMATLQRSSARYFQRPDAAHLRYDPTSKSMSGWTGQVNVNRTRGNLLVDGALWAISPGFESNDAGYSPAADRVGAHTGWIWQKTTPDRWTRDRSATLITYWVWNMGGDLVGSAYVGQLSATMKNYWSLSGSVSGSPARIDDRDTRGGPAMKRVPAWSSSLFLSSDARKKIRFDASGSYERNTVGGWALRANPSLVYRPSSAFSVSAGPALVRSVLRRPVRDRRRRPDGDRDVRPAHRVLRNRPDRGFAGVAPQRHLHAEDVVRDLPAAARVVRAVLGIQGAGGAAHVRLHALRRGCRHDHLRRGGADVHDRPGRRGPGRFVPGPGAELQLPVASRERRLQVGVAARVDALRSLDPAAPGLRDGRLQPGARLQRDGERARRQRLHGEDGLLVRAVTPTLTHRGPYTAKRLISGVPTVSSTRRRARVTVTGAIRSIFLWPTAVPDASCCHAPFAMPSTT